MAKLSDDIFAVPDDSLYPKWFRSGQDVTGSVAKAAKEQGKLVTKRAPKTKAASPPENK